MASTKICYNITQYNSAAGIHNFRCKLNQVFYFWASPNPSKGTYGRAEVAILK
ncbi:hypothetical protein CCACVL1_15646 [Corchorus capsularis]|uniref:Uncharacterized protein n=1 Tax=Corchorus capsularis TaxID=210143 RepID=A0A1R3I1L4_COCAP|nr:hypothetical protein CCACVL1_15646 [Corchorus capsularis]